MPPGGREYGHARSVGRSGTWRLAAILALVLAGLGALVSAAAGSPTPSTIHATEGTPFSGEVVLTDTCAFDSATIEWGDGSSPSVGTGTTPPGGVDGTHTYVAAGTYQGSVTYNDDCHHDATALFTAIVADAPLSASAVSVSVSAEAGQPFSGVVATFTDANPDGVVSQFSAEVSWGDGTAPSAGTVSAVSGGGFSVSGSHTYQSPGSYQLSVTIDDVGGSTASAQETVQVNGLVAHEGEPISGQVATLTPSCSGAALGGASVSIDWGDGTPPSAGTVAAAGSQAEISGSHVYREAGAYSGTASLTCLGSTTSQQASFTVEVQDDPLFQLPRLGARPMVEPELNQPFSSDLVTFCDGNPDSSPADFTATILWGDRSAPSSGTVTPAGYCEFAVSGTHTYAAAGSFSIDVTIRDRGGSRLLATATAIVPAPPPSNACGNQVPTSWAAAPAPGIAPTYTLGGPQDVLDSSGNPTGRLTQTLFFPGFGSYGDPVDELSIIAAGCWQPTGTPQPSGGLWSVVHLYTTGSVVANGVHLVPEGAPGVLIVGSDGSIFAVPTSFSPYPSAFYDVEVPASGEADAPLVIVGQVDLFNHPLLLASGQGFDIVAAPGGPQIGGNVISGGQVSIGAYSAQVSAWVDLPAEFTIGPDSGGRVTAPIHYDVSGPAPSDQSGSSGAFGGGAPTGGCQPPNGSSCGGGDHLAQMRAAPRPESGGFSCPQIPFQVPNLYLGGLQLADVSLTCNAQDPQYPWTGSGELDFDELSGGLPLPAATFSFSLAADGSFHEGSVQLDLGYPGVPVFVLPPPAPPDTGVNLAQLGVTVASRPYLWSGNAALEVVAGTAPVASIDGGAFAVNADSADPYRYVAKDWPGGPSSLQLGSLPITSFAAGIAGTITLFVPPFGEVPLASGYVFAIPADSYYEFAGCLGSDPACKAGLSLLGGAITVTGALRGAANLDSGQYDVSGNVGVCANFPSPINAVCLGASGELSDVGMGACGSVSALGINWGVYFWYEWAGGWHLGFGCDLGPVHVVVSPNSSLHGANLHGANLHGANLHGANLHGADPNGRHAQASGPVSIELPAGIPVTSVTVSGSGGAPLVAVAGPRGAQASDATPGQGADSGRVLIVPMAKLDETMIGLNHPAAGRWTITPVAGSPPITGVSYADALLPPTITVSVTSAGSRRTLHYRVVASAGESIELAERATGVFRVIGRARGASGELRFTPAVGAAGERAIVALVSYSGVPARPVVVGHYLAPPLLAPGRPGRATISQTKGTLIVRWGAASSAAGYLVEAVLSDGRRLSYSEPARLRQLRIPGVQHGTGATVSVDALGTTGLRGPATVAQLAAAGAPAQVQGLRVARSTHGVLISWLRAAGAARYLVEITVGGSAHARLFAFTTVAELSPQNATAMLRAGAVSKVTVHGVNAEGQTGPPETVRYLAPSTKPSHKAGEPLHSRPIATN